MLIANPIYDIVFKKLMENRAIASGMLERILGTTVDQLDFAAQEFTAKAEDGSLKFYRLDFKARILTPDGWKHVLIELQKARLSSDVERFRTYLAEEYRRVYQIPQTMGEPLRQSLPIITIYFFGYTIDDRLPGAVKIDRRYLDLITREELTVRCDVLERLTHDCYAVQIPLLGDTQRNDVEELLAVFRQDHPSDRTRHTLIVDEKRPHTPLIRQIYRTLTRLAETKEVKEKMAKEDVMFEILAREVEEKMREERGRREAAERQCEEERQLREEEQRLRKAADRQREEEQRLRETADNQREEEQRKREAAEAEIARLKRLLGQNGD